ncbi:MULTISPECIES: hypothetical protein [unclassified Moorena]|uniref:hypothetical protein n=1 Tax=unclassified Moorena TaxID=2683338 RepID=UPI0014013761|nr:MULTISPECIES: hypothetical protein [unclassified Moorena]NEO17732.1 hypothetical protein [Moorena sp. SIO3E8]NEQ04279.1 hypothetical protein [Moorena sp. SIO3F7]
MLNISIISVLRVIRYTGFFPSCLLPIAYCLLPITYYLLSIAYCLLPLNNLGIPM